MLIFGLFSSIITSINRDILLISKYLNLNNILHFSNICRWEFDIIITFNTITTLALQMSRIWLINPYLILKLLVFTSICKLYNNRYLSQNRYSLLLLSLSYLLSNFLYLFNPFYPFYPFEPSSWNFFIWIRWI